MGWNKGRFYPSPEQHEFTDLPLSFDQDDAGPHAILLADRLGRLIAKNQAYRTSPYSRLHGEAAAQTTEIVVLQGLLGQLMEVDGIPVDTSDIHSHSTGEELGARFENYLREFPV